MSDTPTGNNTPLLILLGSLSALILGAGGGYFLHALTAQPQTREVTRVEKEQLTPEELLALCADVVTDERETLKQSQDKVKSLQGELDAKVAELDALKAKSKSSAQSAGANAQSMKSLKAELEAKEAEIADLQQRLALAEQERDTALVELKQTVVQLESEIRERKKAQAEATFYKSESQQNAWSAFLAEAKVEICDRGSRNRHEKCHEAVEASLLGDMKSRFMECVQTTQAVPLLRQIEKKGEALPQFAVSLAEDSRFTKNGWYIQFCDPTLPESTSVRAAEPL